jgi:glucose/arabinose dehydrogenase
MGQCAPSWSARASREGGYETTQYIKVLAAAAVSAGLAAGPVWAQDANENLDKLGHFKKTGTEPGQFVDQDTKYSQNIRDTVISKIKLPDGSKIELFAVAPDTRHMAVGRNKATVWIGTRKRTVWSATDRDMDNVADTVEEFSPSVNFDIPNGVCYTADGFPYVLERNRALMFPAAEFFMESPDTVAVPVVPQGELIPVEEESYNRTARVFAIAPDNKLCISLGQPFNVAPPETVEMCDEGGIGGMIRVDRDGTDREVVATGARDSLGMACNPADRTLWFADNQVDGIGDKGPGRAQQDGAGRHAVRPSLLRRRRGPDQRAQGRRDPR